MAKITVKVTMEINEYSALYQINTDICTHISLNHHFINNIRLSNMFQPLKGHLRGVKLFTVLQGSSITAA
jgi:hypothetical protein